MFQVPVKEIIVNDDTQARLLEDDGTVYADNDVSASAGGFLIEGFINEVIWTTQAAAAGNGNRDGKMSYLRPWSGTDKMVKIAAAAGVAETAAFAFTLGGSGGAKQGDTYRLVTDSLDLTPTEYQNRPTEKRYQLGVDCANAAAVVAALVAQINADPKAPVTAYAGFNNASPAQDDSAKIVLVGKTAGVKVDLFVGTYAVVDQTTYTVAIAKSANAATVYHTVEDTSVTTALPTLPVGTYDALKNINWAKNFDIDRDINWMPLPGASYNAYYFEVASQGLSQQLGNNPSPGEVHNAQVYAVKLYVKSGLTLDTALTLLEADVNT